MASPLHAVHLPSTTPGPLADQLVPHLVVTPALSNDIVSFDPQQTATIEMHEISMSNTFHDKYMPMDIIPHLETSEEFDFANNVMTEPATMTASTPPAIVHRSPSGKSNKKRRKETVLHERHVAQRRAGPRRGNSAASPSPPSTASPSPRSAYGLLQLQRLPPPSPLAWLPSRYTEKTAELAAAEWWSHGDPTTIYLDSTREFPKLENV